jgi:phosphoglycerate dehydrogenase-like enzyme
VNRQQSVLLAPYPRTVQEILSQEDLERLASFSKISWARDDPIPNHKLSQLLANAWAYVSAKPKLDTKGLSSAPNLRVIVEVGGGFPTSIDYATFFASGIRVLSCAPACGPQVAEMTLALILAAGRGLVTAHEGFRTGDEVWQGERTGWDFTLFGQEVGFIGCGSLARNLLPLLAPFKCTVRVYDPWLPDSLIRQLGCLPTSLDEVLHKSRVTAVLATPTRSNRGLLDRHKLRLMPQGSLLALMSRAHLVDFDALTEAVSEGRIQAAIDVFPEEPLPREHPVRRLPNVILSAHRAAALRKERHLIGQMLVDDLELIHKGLPPTQLQVAQPELIRLRLGH